MANPRAFLSFDYDHDSHYKMLIAGQAKNDNVPFTIQDWSNKSELPQSQWKKDTKTKINQCNMLIVLVGQYMASATGVVAEIEMAKECDIPLFGIYVNGAGTASNLPTGLARNRTIDWGHEGIEAAVKQMMGEGKNKK